jgi:quercetin dioxygenase-like cupin family protein
MTETEQIEQLKAEGFKKVYIWDAEPGEDDPDHVHAFDTKLIILSGEIEIGMNGESRVLKQGDSIYIARDTVHSGKAGVMGCRYIVGERE